MALKLQNLESEQVNKKLRSAINIIIMKHF